MEDNPADAGLVLEALKEHSVQGEVILLRDGEEAIRFFDRIEAEQLPCPDLLILDLNLPKKPGREVLARVRSSITCNHMAVAVLTSSDAQKDQDDAVRLGATRFLRKPSDLDEFLSLGGVFRQVLTAPR